MNDCPSPRELAGLLQEEGNDPADDPLIEHLGRCVGCRERLHQLSLEIDDWESWESVFQANQLTWPSSELASAQREAASRPSPPTQAGETSQVQATQAFTEHASPASDLGGSAVDAVDRDFGDYELIEKIGAGGMGVVYRARQKSAGRLVALKLIRPEQLEALPKDRRLAWLDRFRWEAQAAARLEHDHVVPVYEVGEIKGVLFYSMQCIDGPSLSQMVRDHPMDNRRAAALMYRVALAIDHAHQQGVLHRDLKPQNILIRPSSSATRSGTSTAGFSTEPESLGEALGERPYVADFGLAKWLEEGGGAGSTHTGEVMGSPSYMSPEQARDASRCTPASDIYSLGATMYDALTGRPPFRASSAVETLRQVLDEEPVPPQQLNPAIELDLQTITLKALAKDPSRRYASAQLLADDLLRYLRGEPIEARPISTLERSVRWCRRNPTVAFLASGVAGLLLVVAIVSVASSVQLRRHAMRETLARTEAEEYFVITLEVIDDMLADFADEWLIHVPQMERARQELLKKALKLYVQLSASKPTNPDLQVQFARTQHRIGDVHDLLGEPQAARRAYQAAIEMFDALRGKSPHDLRLLQFWANSQTMLGETLRKNSPAEAQTHFQQALKAQQTLLQNAPDDVAYRRELSRTLNNLGLLSTAADEYESAEKQLSAAIENLRAISRPNQEQPLELAAVLADLGRSQINLGVLLRKIPPRAAEAEPAYREAIENLRRAVELDSNNRNYQFRLWVATVNLGNIYVTVASNPARAYELTTRARDHFAKLAEEFPRIPIYQYERANASNSSGVALAMLGKLEEAEQQFRQTDEMLNELNNEFPHYAETEPNYQSLKGKVFGGLGFVVARAGNFAAARQLAEQAIQHQQTASELRPQNQDYLKILRQHREFLASVLEQLESPP